MSSKDEKSKLPKGITLRKDGLYMGRVQKYGEVTTLYDKDVKSLKKKMNDLRYELEHGLYTKPSNITVKAWFNNWLQIYKNNCVKQGTLKTYDDCFRMYIEPKFGNIKLVDLRPEAIQKLFNEMNKNFAASTISLVKVVLGEMLKQAVKNGILRNNPVDLVNTPKKKKKEPARVLSREEQKLFSEKSQKSQYAPLYIIALNTGMRSGELRALKWENIDFCKRIISVQGTLKYINKKGYVIDTPKTEKSTREIPMLDIVFDTLKAVQKKQIEDKLKLGEKWSPQKGLENLVFTNSLGKPISNMALNEDINHIEEKIRESKVEFKHMTPHTLRHTFATRGLEQGINTKVVQEILGHTSITMTMDLYSHVLPDMKASELRKLSDI